MRCRACTQPLATDAVNCPNCGAPVVVPAPVERGPVAGSGASADPAVPASAGAPVFAPLSRPNGTGILSGAYFLAFVAVILAAWSGAMDVTTYGEVDGGKLELRWWMMVIAGGLFQLALVGWAVGKITNAIWFVRGEEAKSAAPTAHPPQGWNV